MAAVATDCVSNESRPPVTRAKPPLLADFFTVPEASEATGITQASLNRWRVSGEGPRFAKIANRIYYRRGDLEAWISSKLRSSTSEKK